MWVFFFFFFLFFGRTMNIAKSYFIYRSLQSQWQHLHCGTRECSQFMIPCVSAVLYLIAKVRNGSTYLPKARDWLASEQRKLRHMGQQADRTERHITAGHLSRCIGKAHGRRREMPEKDNYAGINLLKLN